MNEYENEELDAMAEEAAEREEMELAEAEQIAEADAIAADEQKNPATPSEQDGADEDAPEAKTPQKPEKAAPPSMEERMLEMLLREKHHDTFTTALVNGKTIHGAWNYVVSVMKNAYIAQHGRVNGGMCGNANVVCEIAERYLREFPEGYTEPEAAHTPKKKAEAKPKDAKAEVVKTVKAAATAAKKEAKKTKAEKVRALFGNTQLSFNF